MESRERSVCDVSHRGGGGVRSSAGDTGKSSIIEGTGGKNVVVPDLPSFEVSSSGEQNGSEDKEACLKGCSCTERRREEVLRIKAGIFKRRGEIVKLRYDLVCATRMTGKWKQEKLKSILKDTEEVDKEGKRLWAELD